MEVFRGHSGRKIPKPGKRGSNQLAPAAHLPPWAEPGDTAQFDALYDSQNRRLWALPKPIYLAGGLASFTRVPWFSLITRMENRRAPFRSSVLRLA